MGMRWGQWSAMLNITFRFYLWRVDQGVKHQNPSQNKENQPQGQIQDFLGGGALISCSTSTPINHIYFFFYRIPVVLENRRSSQGAGGVCTPYTLPLDPSLNLFQGLLTADILTSC